MQHGGMGDYLAVFLGGIDRVDGSMYELVAAYREGGVDACFFSWETGLEAGPAALCQSYQALIDTIQALYHGYRGLALIGLGHGSDRVASLVRHLNHIPIDLVVTLNAYDHGDGLTVKPDHVGTWLDAKVAAEVPVGVAAMCDTAGVMAIGAGIDRYLVRGERHASKPVGMFMDLHEDLLARAPDYRSALLDPDVRPTPGGLLNIRPFMGGY